MIKLLGEHGTFNRISFGDALWNSVLRPSISHGSAVWMSSALSFKGMPETWQYKAAKLIFNTNMTIPKSALFLELGWEPINDFLDRQRISYFSRLQNLPCTRLCKIVFYELKDSQSHPKWDYLNLIMYVGFLKNAGLDHYLNSDINMFTFKKFFGEYVRNYQC
jgi:hypothetical protein